MSDVTHILSQIEQGDPAAAEQLLSLVYIELRRLATAMLALEKPGQTLQPTALVHEAYLRLVGSAVGNALGGVPGVGGQESGVGKATSDPQSPTSDIRPPSSPSYGSRTHFFAAAAEAMRRILVDQARRKAAVKHGGQLARQELHDSDIAATAPPDEVIAVHEVLDQLAAEDALTADLIKLHYFGGFSPEEAGAHLGLSRATAYRLLTYGKAWLRAALSAGDA
jgi:DNA-directed RNA polymerase specialized sigma24 family protein